MRCWAFDWPREGDVALLDAAGRRWALDQPDNAVIVYELSPFASKSVILLPSRQDAYAEIAVLEAIQTRWKGATVVRVDRQPGEQHPRIWRGRWSRLPSSELESFAGSVHSARLLTERFRQVALTVEPRASNQGAYGHALRHLLILGATDVETAWKAVLVANNFPRPPNDRYTTRDYCALIGPLRLKEWKVRLSMYPGYEIISPFGAWDPEKPTDSLPWYKAYNATKHDREGKLQEATLEQVIAALAGAYVMLCAQFGPLRLKHDPPYSIPEFSVTAEPKWQLAEEYVPFVSDTEPKLVPLTL